MRVDEMEQYDISVHTGVHLNDGQKQFYRAKSTFNKPGEGKKPQFDHFKGNDSEVYPRTYIKLSVSG